MKQEEASAIILEHYRRRQHYAELDEPRLRGEMVNRACGDELTLYLRPGRMGEQAPPVPTSPGRMGEQAPPVPTSPGSQTMGPETILEEISYTGRACSVCIASADLLCEELEGRNLNEARNLAQNFLAQMNGEGSAPLPGQLPALLTLRDFPIRKKCVLMGWQIFLELVGR